MYRRHDKILKDGKPAFTVYDVLAKDPCEDYPEERLLELWGDEDALTADEIAELDIYDMDKCWALARVCMTPVQRTLYIAGCCEAALAHKTIYSAEKHLALGRLIDTLRLFACGLFSGEALRLMCDNHEDAHIARIIRGATQYSMYAADQAHEALGDNEITKKDRLRIALFFANL